VIAAISPQHRALFATAIWTGLRKGELLALRKQDIDIQAREMIVRRSWDRNQTKGGHDDVLPIAEPLVPYLEQAIANAKGHIVFPLPHGSMRGHVLVIMEILRRARARAGIVTKYEHVGRRCGHKEDQQAADERRCPECNMRLWPKAHVRPIRFHDLRHTTAT